MFESLKQLPQDPILQLMQMFRDDIRPDKVDLGVGVYKDDAGCVRYLAGQVPEMVIAASCSKNVGLYRERTHRNRFASYGKSTASTCWKAAE
ncbi:MULTISPECIES: hypothetical protein [unclassified Marinobacter]|uniref:hypothetical protein n=1 Tax=unclassified Marinobacter TaxID=83889 RepID=UPI00200DEFDA|nr:MULTISPECIES: hypothetical protein [unclassified Marinobacter]MCL1477128.1 hypothetical protein [Marinobacter sp.]UQG56512.1 hypothetical protein MIH16_02200 [Marinobacter sp. M4C]UQG65316.1 hypothetical protein MIH17_02200 [Marinobacter sp. M2C]UQG69595.1 hypothetical protein MIH19_02195 [Marinobacter sp. M1C]